MKGRPTISVFKPAGIPAREMEHVVMALDEFEALRLADLRGLYHEAAAERMEVSRATFGRILATARSKVADVLAHGKALRIEGGPVREGRSGPAGGGRRCRRGRRQQGAGPTGPASEPREARRAPPSKE